MYDQSLEQLIDAVIADGVITDQERNVVYKKAASLGIDRDEIEVYLNGKLDAMKKNSGPKSGKHGFVKTCPNCGATVEGGSAKCKECGYAFTGIEANSSAAELDRRLRRITGTEEEDDEKRAHIISSFPIPNTREDLFEFMAATAPKAFNRHKDGEEQIIGKAYYEKFVEALNKAQISFPDDPNTKRFETELAKNKKKIHIPLFLWFFIGAAFCGIMAGVCSWYDDYKEAELSREYMEWKNPKIPEIEEYANSLGAKLEELPTPTPSNYKTCVTKLTPLVWSKNWQVPKKYKDAATTEEKIGGLEYSYKEAFNENISTYKKTIGAAWKQDCRRRGLDEGQTRDEIPYEYW